MDYYWKEKINKIWYIWILVGFLYHWLIFKFNLNNENIIISF